MAEFNIIVTHLDHTNYTIEADDWQEAVEIASDKADEDGLATVGGFAVNDENHRPVDTWTKHEGGITL